MGDGVPRSGYRSVTPRLFVDDVAAQVQFLREVFGAVGEPELERPSEIQIGDSKVMVASTAERDPFPGFLYVYVDDVDRVYEKAVRAGADSLEAPSDQPYGDRRAMIRDPFGNVFQIARPI